MKKLLVLPALAISAVALASCGGGVKEKKYSNKVDAELYTTEFTKAFTEFSEKFSEEKDFVVEIKSEGNEVRKKYGKKEKSISKIESINKYDKDSKVFYFKESSSVKGSGSESKINYKVKSESVTQEDGEKKYTKYDLISKTYIEDYSAPSFDLEDISDFDAYKTKEADYYYDTSDGVKLFTVVYKMGENYEGKSIVQMEFNQQGIEIYSNYDVVEDYNKIGVKKYNSEKDAEETVHYDLVITKKVKNTMKFSFEDVQLNKEDKAKYNKYINYIGSLK